MEGVRGRVSIRMVLVFRAEVKGIRLGRGVEEPLRSANWTVMPRARPMFATRFPLGMSERNVKKGGSHVIFSLIEGTVQEESCVIEQDDCTSRLLKPWIKWLLLK